MPKTGPNKNFKRLSIVSIVVLAIVIFVSGAYSIKYFNQKDVEDRFSRLSLDLKTLQNRVQKEQLDIKSTESKYCYRQSFKFEKGPLRCAITASFAGIHPKDTKKVEGLIANSRGWEELDRPSANTFPYHRGSYRNINNKIDCTADYSEIGLKTDKDFSLILEINCSEVSERAFYPYKN